MKKNSEFLKKIGLFFSKFLVLIVIVAIAGAFIIGFKLAGDDQKPAIIAVMDIEGTIKDIGELATAEYGYTITQIAEKDNIQVAIFEIPYTYSRVVYSYEGLIKAGINFNAIDIIVNEANKTIFIELPDAEILSSEIDFKSLEIYDEKNNILNPLRKEDYNSAHIALKEKAEKSAVSSGLLIRAAENAQIILRTTVMSFYDLTEYKVDFY